MTLSNKNGITIRQLKDFIKDMPDKTDGEDNEVWIGDRNNLSNIAKSLWTLNKGDLLIEVKD